MNFSIVNCNVDDQKISIAKTAIDVYSGCEINIDIDCQIDNFSPELDYTRTCAKMYS
jgi:hypothetical protein